MLQVEGEATGISWLEARDVAKHPSKHSPKTKNYPAQNVNSAETEKVGLYQNIFLTPKALKDTFMNMEIERLKIQ